MPAGADRLLRQVCRLTSRAAPEDAALLGRFVAARDPAAFEALVARHGPMVLRACRRVLGNSHDAEDAFQATFLVLARKAGSVRPAGALAAWLHGVACRIALGTRTAARRQRREAAAPDLDPPDHRPDPLAELTAREALGLLDEEVRRLPLAYRLPVVLCCLEGLSQEEAARQLGLSLGSIRARLERGRKRLHERLTRRGLALGTALALAEVARGAAGPADALTAATVKAAVGGGAVPARVAALAEGGLKALSLARTKAGLLLLLAAGVIAAGAGTLARHAGAGKQPAAPPAGQPRPAGERQARTDRYGDPLPEGALARLGTVRLRAVWAQVGLSPDGKTIVTVSRGRLVKLWDASTGRLVRQRELPVPISDTSFLSPDGRLLAILKPDPGSDPPLDIWDVASGTRIRRLPVPARTGVSRGVFSPDGKCLAVAQYGGTPDNLRLWDIGAGTYRALKGHTGYVENLAFSPDGKRLATTDDQRVICWDTAKGEQLWQAKVAFNTPLAFTPNGRTVIASPGHRERSWRAWEAATGKPASGLKLPEGYNYAQLGAAPDGRTLVFVAPSYVQGADGRTCLWDLRDGKVLRTLPTEGLIGPFTPDGRWFLTNDGALQRWELATGRPLLPDTEALGHRREVGRVVYSPDGRLLASSADDGTVRIWEVATARTLHVLRGHKRDASGLAFTPDGKLLVAGGTDGALRVWDVGTGKEARRIPLHDPKCEERKQHVWRLHVMADGRTVVVLGYDPNQGGGATDGILTSWDLATGRRKSHAGTGPSDGFYIAFSPEGRLLASRGVLLDTATGEERVKLVGAAGAFGHYAFSSDGRLVAGLVTRTEVTATRGTTIIEGVQVWDAATGRARRRIRTDWVGQLAFSPDGRYLAAADLNGLRLWELATGEVVLRQKAHERMRGSFGDSFASCLAFAPDGRTVATGLHDSTILLWSAMPPGRPPTAADLPRLWDELAGTDAAKAYAVSWRLTEAPGLALPFVRKHLRPVSPAPAATVRPLLADLDSNDFGKREAAAARLRELGDRAGGALREAIKAGPSPEKRRRLEGLLNALEGQPSGVTLREARAVAVLERIGTPEARKLLKELAGGVAEARLTREAKASLDRLAKRPAH